MMASKLVAFYNCVPRRVFTAPVQKPVLVSLPSSTKVQSNVRQFYLRRKLFLLPSKATADQPGLSLIPLQDYEFVVSSKIPLLPYGCYN